VFHFNVLARIYTIRISNPIAIPIQKGLNIQNHDQLITLHSFKIINVNPKRAGKPIPVEEDDDFEFDIVYILF
jgi:hypothetical protein